MPDTIRVLHVDSDVDILDQTTLHLEREDGDVEVVTETNVTEALARIRDGDVDCVLSDYMMSGMDGLEFLTQVRDDDPDLPFILYTGRGSEDVASEAISKGATDYVQKHPGTEHYELLANRIRNAVSRYRERVSYQEVFENTGVGMTIRSTETYDLVRANQAFREMLGYDESELREFSFDDITADSEGYDGRQAREMYEIAVQEGSHSFEWPFLAAGGAVIWADVSMELADIRGEKRILTTVRDVTERKEREETLREVNERLDLAIEGTNLGVWDWDLQTDTVTFNDQWAKLLGLSPDEIEPTLDTWRERVHPLDLPDVESSIESHNAGENPYYDLEYRMKTAAGEWNWVRSIGRVVERSGDGTPQRAVGIHIDIDERKQYEQQLKRQRDNLETLNEMVRHDIRNDLQLVLTYLEVLEEYVDDGREYLETARESAHSAVDLTETARELAEAMLQADAERSPLSLRETLHAQIEDVRSTEQNAIVTIDETVPAVNVLANDMLDSVFRNLLQNAIQHNDTDVPHVTVSVTENDGHVLVHIADNGPGIPDQQKERIFGKGERGRQSEGTGMGLYLVETLVDQYGGDVWVEDNEPAGAVFTVKLERTQESPKNWLESHN
jgi:PAS domain S-box-containing protein